MDKAIRSKIGLLSLCFIVITSFVLYAPLVCHGEEYALYFDFSPNIINLDGERFGDIRVLTRMRYSFFVANGDSIYMYFNGCEESVPDIRATRDSLGNLILRFSLENLLIVKNCLVSGTFNEAKVVITMKNGDEYIGEGGVFMNDKKAP